MGTTEPIQQHPAARAAQCPLAIAPYAGLDKSILNQYDTLFRNNVTLPGPLNDTRPTLDHQSRNALLYLTPIAEATVHARNRQPDRRVTRGQDISQKGETHLGPEIEFSKGATDYVVQPFLQMQSRRAGSSPPHAQSRPSPQSAG